MINNVIVYNKIVINGAIYDFGDDGKMVTGSKGGYTYGSDGKLIANNVFVTVNHKTYYLINNVMVVNVYMVIDGRMYFFTDSGARLEGIEYDGFTFGENGYINADFATITLSGKTYYIINSYVYNAVNATGTVYESDNDTDNSNNAVLAGVSATLVIHGNTYTAVSDSNGVFSFSSIPSGSGTLTFSLDGYIQAEMSVNITTDAHLTIVMDRNVSNTLTGKVVVADADNTLSNNPGLAGAKVTITRTTSTNAFHYEATTDSSGYYTFTDLTAGVYQLVVEMEGYISITQTVQVRYNQTTVSNIALEAISSENTQPGYASGTITESLTGSPVSGLTVYIYPGINHTSGAFVDKITTNESGFYITNPIAPGNYTAYVVDERTLSDENLRYTSLAVSIKIMSDVTIQNQNGTVSNNSGLSIDGMRIVLTWGSTPSDLDSHLTFGSNHVYYSQKSIGTSSLDVDDTSAYGPETVTISEFGTYTYTYYIFNFSRYGTMSDAQACVTVYFGNSSTPAYVFYPPVGSGYTWNVFTYNAVTGDFTVVNTLG